MTFVEEMKDETKSQGGDSKVLGSELPDCRAKDQLEVKSKAVSSNGASDLEVCLEIPSIPST